MARFMDGEDAELFRAVINFTTTNAATREVRTSTTYAGPFRTQGAATQAIKREASTADRWGYYRHRGETVDVSGHVERAVTNWERV